MNATDRRALWRPLAYHALAVLAVFASQLLSIWLLSPRLDDFSPTQPAGRERLYNDSIGELSVFAYSTLVVGQSFTDAAAVREDPVKSWLSVLPVVGLSRYMAPSAVSRWATRRLVAQVILLGGVAALGYLRLRRRVPSRRAWELVGLLPFWWAVTGLTAWLYVHLAITPNVQESVAEWLEPLLAIYIGLHVLVVGIVLLRLLARRPVRFRIPLPLLFAELVVVSYLALTHGYPYVGWYDTWPPAFLSSYLYAWAPLGRFVSWFYPVSWPAVGLISLSRRSSAVAALAVELRPSAIFMLFAVLNAVFWLVVIVAWAGARKFHLRQSRAGA